MTAPLLMSNCHAAESPPASDAAASQFSISVRSGTEPVCAAYAKRLERTPLRRELDERNGKWLNNPHCDRGENAYPDGFELLHRVPLTIEEVTRLQPQVDAFLRSPNGAPTKLAAPDPISANPPAGSAQFRQSIAIKNGDHFYFYRFQPRVDIDNDGRPDDVIVWKEWGGICGELNSAGDPTVLRTDVLVLTDKGDLDMKKTRQIFAHPKGPMMAIQNPTDPSHPHDVPDTEFRPVGKTLGVFKYRGMTYFDTFYAEGGDLDNLRDGTQDYLNTLAVLRNKGSKSQLLCEIVVK